jgi:hypothetical protein
MKKLLVLSSFVCLSSFLLGQVHLNNASFEGEPQDATVPVGWFPCAKGTTPDILPGFWGVYAEPSEGETYLGLITRDDGTWESIGQRIKTPIQTGSCYELALDLAHSKTYSGYDQPIKLRVWGGVTKCAKNQLILETDFINHADWRTYTKQFTAKMRINYLIFEAYYKDGSYSHKGNILIDYIRPLKKCIRA